MAYLWAALMAVWLAALASGVWWIWPHVTGGIPPADLAGGALWLLAGGAAWLLALRIGRERYWPRRARPGAGTRPQRARPPAAGTGA